jgi:D-inositol-3-phosphate glycosyltransferase
MTLSGSQTVKHGNFDSRGDVRLSEKTGRPRILVIGDAAVPTGFARVVEGIFRPLAARYEIHQLGTNYLGDPHGYSWKVYPAEIGGDRWGTRRVLPLIERLQPQLIFILNDIWVQSAYMNELGRAKERPPVILYCPVDGGPIDPETIAPLAGVARCVVYTEFGRQQVEAAAQKQREMDSAFVFPEVLIIPHGVDTETFYPLQADDEAARRLHARKLLFPDETDLAEQFIVLNANRNQPRKRIDTTIRGFALFARNKPSHVKLFLHMGVEDVGWNVILLARRYGVEDQVLMSSLAKTIQGVSTAQLNRIYNACDVGINTSSAEGWGLPNFEHAATRAAQVVPRHTACAELWEGAAMMLEPAFKVINERVLTDAWLVTPETVAEALEKLYVNREFLSEMSERAFRTATRPDYQWGNISERWDALFHQVIEQGMQRP